MACNGEEIIRTFKKMVLQREPLEQYWRDAFDYSYPIRGQGLTNKDGSGTDNAAQARATQAKLFDSTATDACRLLASSMISGLTPSTSQWFMLGVPNVSDSNIPRDARSWLQKSSETLHSMIHGSNFNAQALEFFVDIAIAGQCGLYVERPDTGGLYFEHWPLSSLYCRDSLRQEMIDTVFRTIKLTAGEAREKFGEAKLSEPILEMLERDEHSLQEFQFVHVIRPRMIKGKQSNGKLNKQLPFESVYVCMKTKKVVHESGYHEFPAIIPRWMTIPDTDYAVGPLNDALPDVKTVNKVVEMTLQNGEMQIAGMYVMKDDNVLNPNAVRIGPRRIVMVRDTNDFKAIPSAGNFNVAAVEIKRLQAQIKRIMMSDELAPADRPQMTAEEVRSRTQMIRQILGPVFGRLQSEFLNPLIRRCFGLAFRAGDLGMPPESLKQYDFMPNYKSPLARAQRLDDVDAMDRYEARLSVAAQISPDVLDLYDMDKAYYKRAELVGLPVDLIREERDVEMLRKKRAEQQAAQATAEQAAMMEQQPVKEAI